MEDIIRIIKQAIKLNWYRLSRKPNGIIGVFIALLLVWYCLIWIILEPIGLADHLDNFCNSRIFYHTLFAFLFATITTIVLEIRFRKFIWNLHYVTYRAHIQNIGWLNWNIDGEIAGPDEIGLRLEALEIKPGKKLPPNCIIRYQAHVQNEGWQQVLKINGQQAGTIYQNLRMEAIKIELLNAQGYHIIYSVRTEGAWSKWYMDNEIAGTVNQALSLEAIKIMIYRDKIE